MPFIFNPFLGKFDYFQPKNFSFNFINKPIFVPEDQQMIVHGEIMLNDTLTFDGEIVLI